MIYVDAFVTLAHLFVEDRRPPGWFRMTDAARAMGIPVIDLTV